MAPGADRVARGAGSGDRHWPSSRTLAWLALLLGLPGLGRCEEAGAQATSALPAAAAASMSPKQTRMWMTVGERRFAVAMADNAAARAFAAQLPLALHLSELNGNEKHAELPQPLPGQARRPGTLRAGDLMLYGTQTLVVFYSTFASSYSYTRLGRVQDPAGLAQALGRRDVRVAFSRD
ncbi:cyclophilin-like fold protein [Xanthomonas sp.]|uniref:cyclophilin-like fold protein n=1 Tax=Xanthomonas sp. TaxID=29446 RepID=UPI001F13C86B|nr:cyclophilin-like fold protein [Xanthomonas sp.]